MSKRLREYVLLGGLVIFLKLNFCPLGESSFIGPHFSCDKQKPRFLLILQEV
jgi:hypothetical protein